MSTRCCGPTTRPCDRRFERFGGTVAKFIGDAVYVLYGAPRAHEDDPERAVRAALAALQAVADVNAARADLDLHLHIGVTTGEALVTFGPKPDESGGMAWGDILNTASRLEAAAAADTILVDDATYRATRHVIEYHLAQPVHAKGKAEPVPVWQPVGLLTRERRSDPPADRRAQARACPPGGNARRSAVAFARLQLVTIVGEPGLGKSRLILEFFRRIETGLDAVTFRLGRSPPYPDGVSFWALGEIVKCQAEMLETDGAAVAADKLHTAVRELVSVTADAAPDRRPSAARWSGLAAPAQARGDQRGAAFAAWRHFLEALARRRPLVLVFEDIQWADDGLLGLHRASRRMGPRRAAPDRRHHAARASRAPPGLRARTTMRPRSPSRRSRRRRLASSCGRWRGESALSPGVTDAIVASAAGNPLYSVEFIRMLADRGLLAPSSANVAPVALGTLPVPESVRSIIASRLDSLPAEEKALIQAGAVMGRVVWPGALSAVTGHPRRWVVRRLRLLRGPSVPGPGAPVLGRARA